LGLFFTQGNNPTAILTAYIAKPSTEPNRFVVKLPAADFNETALDNLHKLVASKATLLKKALDDESLPIVRGRKTLNFQWFNRNPTPEEAAAFTQLVTALGEMRIFRCFFVKIEVHW
jgi:hypothetical protein